MLVMMAFNRALAGSAATAGVRGPSGCGKGREKKDHCEETDDGGKRAPAVLMASGHANPKHPKSYPKPPILSATRAGKSGRDADTAEFAEYMGQGKIPRRKAGYAS
jgi:glycine/D-amino acid oxidase-like deaminating enzyme